MFRSSILIPSVFGLGLFMAFSMGGPACAADDPILGLWQTADKDAVVQFYACGEGEFCGRFYWLKDDSAEAPSLDDKNRDPALRKRPLCGLTFLGGFRKEGEERYGGGWLYSPRHGHSFSAALRLESNDRLALRGYVFLPFLGGGQTWTRIDRASPCQALASP